MICAYGVLQFVLFLAIRLFRMSSQGITSLLLRECSSYLSEIGIDIPKIRIGVPFRALPITLFGHVIECGYFFSVS
jgi:hypothetical protein